ncbi:MAG: T9SS type A sorting domain-containing protein, partial [Chitinophagaceae bacterium]
GSTMTVTRTTIDGNLATGPDATHGGGGIFNNGGTLMINQSTVSNNQSTGAAANGGGLHVKTGTAMIMTSTFSGNASANHGGGIYANNNDVVLLNAVTVAMNMAMVNGGGFYNNNSMIATDIKNSIVSQNTAVSGMDLFGAFSSGGYNIAGTDAGSMFIPATGDLEDANPLLGPLANNGGTTLTHALLQGSPAYNAGNPADMFNDQIDMPVFDAIRDIGALESQVSLGIEEFLAGNGRNSHIYPNPSRDGLINIAFASVISEEVHGRVVEVGSGRVVHEFSSQTPVSQLDLSKNASGVYVIHLSSNNLNESHKVVLE